MPICICWLSDSAFAVREAGCRLMKELVKSQNSQELEKIIITKLVEIKASKNYLLRNTAIILIREFGNDSKLLDFFESNLLSILTSLVKDSVSNVKLGCAMVLKKLMKLVKNKDSTLEIKGALEYLKKDKDIDIVNAIID